MCSKMNYSLFHTIILKVMPIITNNEKSMNFSWNKVLIEDVIVIIHLRKFYVVL